MLDGFAQQVALSRFGLFRRLVWLFWLSNLCLQQVAKAKPKATQVKKKPTSLNKPSAKKTV